ncbi:MAG TPA: BolA family transcriptional regulator [Sedimenticola thiotaurini]|uniref:BolA family transcriptional regulator n=1 Tax=Sedimenticola thiotaurini TaxID=1543721 RepID=A0A831RMN4_9GAMM|nr:BolA family transcriptional regulator [Sedimenticola thiotaurini]
MSVKQSIEQTLRTELSPVHLEVLDETHMHNVPKDAQSHFKVTVVSRDFAGKAPVQRHRLVNQLLKPQFESGLHALALHTLTPEEWFSKGGRVADTPECLGGGAE